MILDWNNIDRSSQWIDRHFFYPFYHHLNQVAQNHSTSVRLAAPAIGIIDGTASCIQATSGIAEAAIKGVGNSVQAAFLCDPRYLKIGGLQLILGVGVIGASSIPIIAFRTLRITIKMAIDPQETSRVQAENYLSKIEPSTSLASSV